MDAGRFFGRTALTSGLVDYLKSHRFLAVIGASGSGKSSVVRAGVVAALQNGALAGSDKWWIPPIITPTARPLKALAASLMHDSESVSAQATLMDDLRHESRSLDLFASRILSGKPADQQRLLLVVDQFEELFTLGKKDDESYRAEQQAFVDNLLTAAHGARRGDDGRPHAARRFLRPMRTVR